MTETVFNLFEAVAHRVPYRQAPLLANPPDFAMFRRHAIRGASKRMCTPSLAAAMREHHP